MKYLGLDYGDRRVGVALSDPEGTIAFARDFLLNDDEDRLLVQTLEICHKEDVAKVILGWPMHTSGQEGERTQKTRQFADQLKKAIPGLNLELFDERFTTQWATDKLRQAGVRAKGQRGEKDSLAAQILLQTYLDGLHP